MAIIAPTEYGKTWLWTHGLRPMFTHTITLDVKGDGDPSLARSGRRLREGPTRMDVLFDEEHHYRVDPGYGPHAGAVFGRALDKIWRANARKKGRIQWAVYVDEFLLAVDELRLGPAFKKILVAGRSRDITFVASNQAATGPKVPQQFYSQPKWHVFGATRDDRVLYRLSEIGSGDKEMMRRVIPELDEEAHELLIVGPGRYAARTVVDR